MHFFAKKKKIPNDISRTKTLFATKLSAKERKRERETVWLCVCVCVRERERERERETDNLLKNRQSGYNTCVYTDRPTDFQTES